MEEPRYLQADLAFRGGAHNVRLRLAPAALGVEVEAHGTAETWGGEFDATFIEELTHKTGNFKQFGVFCNMLEAALTQSSESVSLELLTYADLETLRGRKWGAGGKHRVPPTPVTVTSPLGSKRYLILVYCVEFDRIHYPLPLPPVAGPDPAALHRLLGELREEVTRLRAGHGDNGHQATQIRHLRDRLQRALEKRAAEGTELRRVREELEREKARQRQLATQLAEAKASERRLQQRVKSLTAELASYKRGSHRTPLAATTRGPRERRSTSRESRGGSQGRPPSPAGSRPPRFDPTAFVRARQRRRQEVEELQKGGFWNLGVFLRRDGHRQRRGTVRGSTSPARSRGRSSSAESFRSRRSGLSSGSEAEEHPKLLHPPRGRRETRTQRALSALSWNSPAAAPRPAANKRPGKENCSEEPSAELAEIDARLQALQEYMESLDTGV